MRNQRAAYAYALLAVFFWSTVASAFKLTLRRVDFVGLLFYSSLASAMVLFLLLIAQRKLTLLRGNGRKEEGSVDNGRERSAVPFGATANILRSMAGGFLNPFLYYLVLFKAYDLLPAQEAQPLNYTWPVVIAVMAVWILGERIKTATIIALLVSFTGVLVISTRGHPESFRFADPLGDGLAVGSSVVWSSYWLLTVRDKRDPVVKLFVNFFFGFVIVAILCLSLSRSPELGARLSGVVPAEISFPPSVDPTGLAGCIYVGLFEMGFTFVLWLKALERTEITARVSNLVYLSPFVSLIFIRLVVGETIMPSSIIGLVLIMAGVVMQKRFG